MTEPPPTMLSVRLVFVHESYDEQAVVFTNLGARVMLGMPVEQFERLGRPEHVNLTVRPR